MQLISLLCCFNRHSRVAASAIARASVFNARTTHKRCLQAWAAVLRWAFLSDCDRVQFQLDRDKAFRFYKGQYDIEISEVSQPDREIQNQIYWSVIRAFSPFGILSSWALTRSLAPFVQLDSGTFFVDDELPSAWNVNIRGTCVVFTLKREEVKEARVSGQCSPLRTTDSGPT